MADEQSGVDPVHFKLSGWKAIVAFGALGAFALIRFNMQSAALQADGVAEIKRWLVSETMRNSLADMRDAAESGNLDYLEQAAANLAEENFDIVSVTRHGLGDRIVARLDYRYKGEAPRAEPRVRYLRMTYSLATGWRVQSETTKLNYYLAAF
ncbi:MAG TPA: hypothetical protein VF322_00570 [Gammaproteobacteria bacterium]